MIKSKQDLILEGLRPSNVNEAGMIFRPYYGARLTKDFGDSKKGTLFYCQSINQATKTVKLARQDNKSYVLELPISVAQSIFSEVSGLERGKTYTLDIDFNYSALEYIQDMNWPEKFVKKYTKGKNLVFPKGTKFKFIGADMAGDNFEVDGVWVPISNIDDIPNANDTCDIFKESKGATSK